MAGRGGGIDGLRLVGSVDWAGGRSAAVVRLACPVQR
jgi:hypothetical protein